jgi:hypothetical protein
VTDLYCTIAARGTNLYVSIAVPYQSIPVYTESVEVCSGRYRHQYSTYLLHIFARNVPIFTWSAHLDGRKVGTKVASMGPIEERRFPQRDQAPRPLRGHSNIALRKYFYLTKRIILGLSCPI